LDDLRCMVGTLSCVSILWKTLSDKTGAGYGVPIESVPSRVEAMP